MSSKNLGLNRKSLCGALGIKPTESSIGVAVDRELAKLFGAKLLLTKDWSRRLPQYTLEDIGDILSGAGVDVSAQDFVGERLSVSSGFSDNYRFDPIGSGVYQFVYARGPRKPISVFSWY